MIAFCESRYAAVLGELRDKKNLDNDLKAKINKTLEEFKALFIAEEKK